MLQRLMSPLARFAGVAMIDAAFPKMGNASDDALIRFNIDRTAAIAAATDCFSRIEIPRVVREMTIGQSADRANRDAHAAVGAERVFQASAKCGRDARFSAANGRLDRRDANHLIADARAARAHDAAIPLVIDGVAEMRI